MQTPRPRIVAGVTIGEPLGETELGSTYRASTASRRDLTALVVAAPLAGHARFRGVLLDAARRERLTSFSHDAVVTTVSIAEHAGDLVVVTLGARDARTAADVLAEARGPGGRPTLEVTTALALGLVDALAALHGRGLVHGAIHPRSLVIGGDGQVQLGDVALGAALGTAIGHGLDDDLWRTLRGYLASELTRGGAPTPASDVYAAGAVVFTSSLARRAEVLRTTPAVERVVHRALDGDPARRQRDGAEQAAELREAFGGIAGRRRRPPR
ncbi:MAG: hypothetical protein R2939_05875 [Kofleriaceae bacterium]